MRIAFACPECDATTQTNVTPETGSLECVHCHHQWETPTGAFEGEKLERCLACGGGELFIRKDFSQRLGIILIATAATISSIFYWYRMHYWALGTLFVGAAVDLALYNIVGNLLQCYRCHSEYRGMPGLEQYEPFNLEVHERYRQQAIRLKEAEQAQASVKSPAVK